MNNPALFLTASDNIMSPDRRNYEGKFKKFLKRKKGAYNPQTNKTIESPRNVHAHDTILSMKKSEKALFKFLERTIGRECDDHRNILKESLSDILRDAEMGKYFRFERVEELISKICRSSDGEYVLWD